MRVDSFAPATGGTPTVAAGVEQQFLMASNADRLGQCVAYYRQIQQDMERLRSQSNTLENLRQSIDRALSSDNPNAEEARRLFEQIRVVSFFGKDMVDRLKQNIQAFKDGCRDLMPDQVAEIEALEGEIDEIGRNFQFAGTQVEENLRVLSAEGAAATRRTLQAMSDTLGPVLEGIGNALAPIVGFIAGVAEFFRRLNPAF